MSARHNLSLIPSNWSKVSKMKGVALVAALILAISCNVVAEDGDTETNNGNHQSIAQTANVPSTSPLDPALQIPESRADNTAANDDLRANKHRNSDPVIVGNPGGQCDHGPTHISAEPDVSRAAHPGTMLHYGPVTFMNYAAEQNRYETEACALSTGDSPVNYTLHIRSIDELKAYGALAKNSRNLKLDLILATEVTKTAPTPTPEICIREHPSLVGKGKSDGYIEWFQITHPCNPDQPPGSVVKQDLPEKWKGYPERTTTGQK